MTTVNARVVTDGLIALLEGIPNHQVGDTDAPDVIDGEAFTEVKMLPAGRDDDGNWAEGQAAKYLNYQLLTVSQNRAAAEDYGWKVAERIIASGVGSVGYKYDIPLEDGHVVAGRSVTSTIGAVDSGRSKGYLAHYRLYVHNTTPTVAAS